MGNHIIGRDLLQIPKNRKVYTYSLKSKTKKKGVGGAEFETNGKQAFTVCLKFSHVWFWSEYFYWSIILPLRGEATGVQDQGHLPPSLYFLS